MDPMKKAQELSGFYKFCLILSLIFYSGGHFRNLNILWAAVLGGCACLIIHLLLVKFPLSMMFFRWYTTLANEAPRSFKHALWIMFVVNWTFAAIFAILFFIMRDGNYAKWVVDALAILFACAYFNLVFLGLELSRFYRQRSSLSINH